MPFFIVPEIANWSEPRSAARSQRILHTAGRIRESDGIASLSRIKVKEQLLGNGSEAIFTNITRLALHDLPHQHRCGLVLLGITERLK
jgi:hypothetical protein